MSNGFNNYFTSIGQEVASKLPPSPPFIQPETPEIPAFTFPAVQKQLQNMPKIKAVRLDRLPGRLIRAAAPIISEPLAYILNLSLQSGKLIVSGSMIKYYLFSNLDLYWKETIVDPFLFYLFYQNYWNILCIVVSVNTLKSVIS